MASEQKDDALGLCDDFAESVTKFADLLSCTYHGATLCTNDSILTVVTCAQNNYRYTIVYLY